MSVQAPVRGRMAHQDARNANSYSDMKPTINLFVGNNTFVGGSVNGDVSQPQIQISNSTIGSVEVVTPTMPPLLPPVTGTSFLCDPGEFGGERALVSTLCHILTSMNFSHEFQQQSLARIKNLSAQTGQSGCPVKPTEKCAKEFRNKLNEITSEDDIKSLVNDGFDALIRETTEAKPALDFITAYKDEELSIPAKFYERRQHLKEIQDLVWEEIYYRIASETCERYREGGVDVVSTLACIVTKLTNKLSLQIKVQRAIFLMRFFDGEVFALGQDYVSDKKFVNAVVVFFTAAKLALQNPDPEYAVRKIQLYLHHIRLVVENNVEKPSKYPPVKAVVMEIVIPLMHKMINYLRSVEDACHKLRIEKEAWCLGCVSACYALCSEFKLSIGEINTAVALMDREFPGRAEAYRVYGMCINNKGSGYQALGDKKNARIAYDTALSSYKKVEDWQNEAEKRDTMAKAKENLQKLRKK